MTKRIADRYDRNQLTLGLRSPEEDWVVSEESRQAGRAAIAGAREGIAGAQTDLPGLQKPQFSRAGEPFKYVEDLIKEREPGESVAEETTGQTTESPSGEPF